MPFETFQQTLSSALKGNTDQNEHINIIYNAACADWNRRMFRQFDVVCKSTEEDRVFSMRNFIAVFVGIEALHLRQCHKDEEKLISTIHTNIYTIPKEPLRSKCFQSATYELRCFSKHEKWKQGRLVQHTINLHVNIGQSYLSDMTFNANFIDIV